MAGYEGTTRLPCAVCYDDPVLNGDLQLLALGTGEMKIFSATNMEAQAKLNRLARSNVINWPTDFNPMDLKIPDRFALLLDLRVLSWGPEYEFFYKCSDCDKKTIGLRPFVDDRTIFTLRDLEKDVLGTDDARYPFITELPNGKVVEWGLLSGSDDQAIRKYGEQSLRRLKPQQRTQEGDPEYSYRTARRIISLDQDSEVSLDEKVEFVESLRGMDELTLRSAFEDVRAGYRLIVDGLPCEHCGWLNGPMRLPISDRFFRPRPV